MLALICGKRQRTFAHPRNLHSRIHCAISYGDEVAKGIVRVLTENIFSTERLRNNQNHRSSRVPHCERRALPVSEDGRRMAKWRARFRTTLICRKGLSRSGWNATERI